MRLALVAVIAGCAAPKPVTAPPPAKPIAAAPPHKFVAPPIHADSPLIADLPSGGFALFAGNVYEFQHWVESAVGEAFMDVTDAAGISSMRKLMTCFGAEHDVRTASSIAQGSGGHLEMRSVMLGISMADVVRCNKDSGFGVALDRDGKFVRVEFAIQGKTFSFSQLELADHALYSQQMFGVLPAPAPTRAELEADQSTAATHSMADAHDLLAIARAVDQQPMWFAMDGKLSPWPAQVAEAHGTIDFRDGFHVVIDAEVIDHALRDQMVAGVTALKQQKLPPEAKALVDGLQLTDDGNMVHAVIDWSQAQVKSISDLLSKMIGARRKSTTP
jgi:hypothetical protein